MIKKVFSTSATRLLAALISFIIVVINSRNLGPQGVGIIGILILDVSIISTINSIFGGPSLVYFTPRREIKPLMVISFFSSFPGIVLMLLVYWLLLFFQISVDSFIPHGYFHHILIMVFLQSLLSNNLNLILGREKIYTHNLLTVIQVVVMVLTLIFQFYIQNNISIISWIIAFYASQILPLLISLFVLFGWAKSEKGGFLVKKQLIAELLRFGFVLQLASLIQLFNYRLPYYFLNSFFPTGVNLGVFTVGTQLTEGLLILSKSVAMVQYSRITNTSELDENVILTIRLLKFTIIFTLFLILIILLIPASFFIDIFYFTSFGNIKLVILFLSPGIMAMSANLIFSHFLSGIGMPKFNFYSSFFGLISIFIFSFVLIPEFGLIGAAVSTSISYLVSMFSSFYYFRKFSKISINELIINKNDIIFLRKSIRFLISRK